MMMGNKITNKQYWFLFGLLIIAFGFLVGAVAGLAVYVLTYKANPASSPSSTILPVINLSSAFIKINFY